MRDDGRRRRKIRRKRSRKPPDDHDDDDGSRSPVRMSIFLDPIEAPDSNWKVPGRSQSDRYSTLFGLSRDVALETALGTGAGAACLSTGHSSVRVVAFTGTSSMIRTDKVLDMRFVPVPSRQGWAGGGEEGSLSDLSCQNRRK